MHRRTRISAIVLATAVLALSACQQTGGTASVGDAQVKLPATAAPRQAGEAIGKGSIAAPPMIRGKKREGDAVWTFVASAKLPPGTGRPQAAININGSTVYLTVPPEGISPSFYGPREGPVEIWVNPAKDARPVHADGYYLACHIKRDDVVIVRPQVQMPPNESARCGYGPRRK